MKYSVVIPSAGSGSRMNLGYNKLFYKIDEETIIEKTVKIFLNDPRCERIILVVSEQDEVKMKMMFNYPNISFTLGGETREESVYNGVKLVKSPYVLIHDAARPFLSTDLLNIIVEVLEKNDVVAPYLKSKDAIRSLTKEGQKYASTMVLVQTPQGMKTSIIKSALSKARSSNVIKNFKDDISLIEEMLGIQPYLVNGEYANIKITTIEDIKKT